MQVPIIHCSYDKLMRVEELRPHPKNPNKHSKEQIERLAQILGYQGFRYPIKISNRSGFITAGHGRLEAAKKNGWQEVPVDYQDYESEEQEYADLVADNAIAEWAELDLSNINADLPELGPDFDLDLFVIKDFVLDLAGEVDLDDKPRKDNEAKHLLEVEFKSESEMIEVYEELLGRELIVRCK